MSISDLDIEAVVARLDSFDQKSRDIDGWLTVGASVLCGATAAIQNTLGFRGDVFEIGAWHGKSAALWMEFLRSGETLHVVDIEARQQLVDNLERLSRNAVWKHSLIKGNSLRFAHTGFIGNHLRSMRIIHIDGDHSAAGIANDLALCAPMLHPHGVMIIDDFMNDRFPQITEVVYSFLLHNMHEYGLLVSGCNKAIVVNAKFYDFWYASLSAHLPKLYERRQLAIKFYEATALNRPCIGLKIG